jgi:branched-chain amino acid transport system permease protein
MGLTIILAVALLPRGLIGLPDAWRARLVGRPSRRAETTEAGHGLA